MLVPWLFKCYRKNSSFCKRLRGRYPAYVEESTKEVRGEPESLVVHLVKKMH